MPACMCGFCRAKRDGRLEEYVDWKRRAMQLTSIIGREGATCRHNWRRVRTLGHPIKGELECRNCYVYESESTPFLIEEAVL